jgi:hypothetical protein
MALTQCADAHKVCCAVLCCAVLLLCVQELTYTHTAPPVNASDEPNKRKVLADLLC